MFADDALSPSELTPEQRDRVERARYMARILIPELRLRRHPIERDPDAVAFTGSGLVSLVWPDYTITYDEGNETVSEFVRDPIDGGMAGRTFGTPVTAEMRAPIDLDPLDE